MPIKDRETYNAYMREYRKKHPEFMREYRIRKKYYAKAEEIKAFLKTFGPFQSDFRKMLQEVLVSDNRLKTIDFLRKKNESLIEQQDKEFHESQIRLEVLKKTKPLETPQIRKIAQLEVHIEGTLQKIGKTRMVLDALEFSRVLIETTTTKTLKQEVKMRV